MPRLPIVLLFAGAYAGPFFDCPRVDVSPSEFWSLMDSDPRPRILPPNLEWDPTRDIVLELQEDPGVFVGDVMLPTDALPYQLTNQGYAPGVFKKLHEAFPSGFPPAVKQIYLRPVFSAGLNGTGEVDIAHHYHSITAMLLLHGQKIWALRPPWDKDCGRARNDCLDPFDVCEYYARNAIEPHCVHNAGETIVVPDGWFHGTCNNSTLTLGWGGQGRVLPLEPGSSSAGLPLFATAAAIRAPSPVPPNSADRMLGASEAAALIGRFARLSEEQRVSIGGGVSLVGLHDVGLRGTVQPIEMAVRALFQQFAGLRGKDLLQREQEAQRFGLAERTCAVLGFTPEFVAAERELLDLFQVSGSLHCLIPLVTDDGLGLRKCQHSRDSSTVFFLRRGVRS